MKDKEIVLVHPRDGIYNQLYKPWLPLSLLSACSVLVAEGFPVRLIDTRVSHTWRQELCDAVREGPLLVGVTCMTGSQIQAALEVSRAVRDAGSAPLVWGGPHPSLFPAQTLENPFVDILVQGEGEYAFHELACALRDGRPLDGIPGVWFKRDGQVRESPRRPFLDMNDLPDIPYHLVDIRNHLHRYFSEEEVLEVETSRGCPYACKFCYNALYNFRKFRAQEPGRVVANLKKLNRDHGVEVFHFIDDAFFVNRARARGILEQVLRENLSIRMGFQGIRIDTMADMPDEDLDLLYRAGGRFLQFGVESGSPRILEMIDKRIRIEQVHQQNRRLARYPGLVPLYNLMCGFPGETRADLMQTAQTAWTLLRENHQALISPFHHYKHYPGTALYEQAKDELVNTPRSLEAWASADWTDTGLRNQTPEAVRLMKKMETVSIFADRKIEMQTNSPVYAWLAKLYRPVARARLRKGFYGIMPEQWLLDAFTRLQRARN